ELETDKVTLEVNAPAAGALQSIAAEEGATVEVGALLGVFSAGAAGEAAPAAKAEAPKAEAPKAEAPQASPAAAAGSKNLDPAAAHRTGGKITKADLMAFLEGSAVGDLGPAVRKLVEENNLDPAVIPASGKDGRLTKEDVINFLEGKTQPLAAPAKAPAPAPAPAAPAPAPSAPAAAGKREERVRMPKLRQTIARRLKEAQNT
ncbi:E3 binding domain-containing protein, partial [Altererythrobacter sp.]|uniref:E3 binding domain-containing protein n=1 Tax=Altererythrobacter sp. TaxID=1872480 RepID=UPI003D13A495